MRRLNLPELGDCRALPARLRSELTGLLAWQIGAYGLYAGAAPLVARLLRHARGARVLDLASGSGGPWPGLLRQLGRADVTVTLTDAVPQPGAWAALADPRLRGHCAPVQLPAVPAGLGDLWTLFTALHHLDAAAVTALLLAARRARVPFGAFELTRRSGAAPLALLAGVPELVRDARQSLGPRFAWHRLPVLLAAYLWDAWASHWRSWEPAELQALLPAAAPGYAWEVGRAGDAANPLTWVLGLPSPGGDTEPTRQDLHDPL